MFCQPLFLTSRQVRDEALEAFYKTNTFLWIIEHEEGRSNPAHDVRTNSGRDEAMITPAFPWDYPHLPQHLRHLHVNIYLPKEENERAWRQHLQSSLSSMIEALDSGRRLQSMVILFTCRRINTLLRSLSTEHLQVLNTLSQMEVPGTVRVRTRYDIRQIKMSIDSLGLEKAMRSANQTPTTSDDS